MAIPHTELLRLIQNAFPEGDIQLTDLVGDEDHYQVHIKDPQFKELNKVQQHRLVHSALEGQLGGKLHALSIKTSA